MTSHLPIEAIVGRALDATSGLVILGLAVFVGTRRTGQLVNLVFAFFAGLWGMSYLVGNLAGILDWPTVELVLANVIRMLAILALVWLGVVLPPGLRVRWPWLLSVAVVLPLVAATSYVAANSTAPFEEALNIAANDVFRATLLSVSALCALRCAGLGLDGPNRGQETLVGAAILIDPALRAGIYLGTSGLQMPSLLAAVMVTAVAWLWAAARVKGSDRRSAQNVGLLALALTLTGQVLGLWLGADASNLGPMGVARMLTVAILGYAVLRHQLLGIEVKVRWTISKTTLAAIFVAVFFIVSEAAQEFFGQTLGSTYIGILAAGLLVFGMTPLSRFADRLAQKAVPLSQMLADGRPPSQLTAGAPKGVYRAAVRAAMRDGILTRREEVHLADVAEGLGIGPRQALEIRGEVEEETD